MSDQAAIDAEALASLADAPTPTSTETEAVQPTEGQGQPDVPTSAEVQPDPGQGQPGDSTGLYDLSTVPEEYREHVSRIAEDINRNANSKFQEHAEFRKAWEPYSELSLGEGYDPVSVSEIDPEGLSALLRFAEDISNPESARDALLGMAAALGVDLSGGEGGLEGEVEDDNADVPLTRAEFEAWQQEREQAAAQQQALQDYHQQSVARFQAEYAAVEQQHGRPFSTEPGPNGGPSERQRLVSLAERFAADHDEPIKAAYQFLQSVRGEAERALVNSQPTPPAPAEPAGRASSSVQPVDDWDTALRLHKERNRNR